MSWEEDVKRMSVMTAALNAQTQQLAVLLEGATPEMQEWLKTISMPDFESATQDYKRQAMVLGELRKRIERAFERATETGFSGDPLPSGSPPAS